MNQLIENVYTVFNKQLSEYNKQRSEKIELAYVGECQGFYVFAVNEYAKKHNLNPFKILAEMYDKGYINYETRIDYQKKEDFIKEYSYLCDSKNIKGE